MVHLAVAARSGATLPIHRTFRSLHWSQDLFMRNILRNPSSDAHT